MKRLTFFILRVLNVKQTSLIRIGYFKPGAKFGKLPDSGKPLLADLGKNLIPGQGQISVGPPAAAAHPAPDLVKLGKAHVIRVLDDDGEIGRAHV